MSARDVLAEAAWRVDWEIAYGPQPTPSWDCYRANDPETAAIYYTQAGCYLSDLRAAGFVVVPAEPSVEMVNAAIRRPDYGASTTLFYGEIYRAMIAAAQEPDNAK